MWNFLGAERQINKVQEGKFCILELIEIKTFSHLCVSLHHNVSPSSCLRRREDLLLLSLCHCIHPHFIPPPHPLRSPFTSSLPEARPPFIHLPQPLSLRAFYLTSPPHFYMFNPFTPPPSVRPYPSLPSSPSSPSILLLRPLLPPPSEDIKLTVCD